MSRSLGLASGVVSIQPDELLVRVRAGTLMAELREALAVHRQRLRIPMVGTVGGCVASRRNGPFPSDNRAMPNIVLQISATDGEGRHFRAGGTTVKNVSGFDLVKVLVGSRGTLATITEVLFRSEPIPAASRWFSGTGATSVLYRPSLAAEIDGRFFVNIEGHPDDVEEQYRLLDGYDEIDAPSDEWLVTNGQSSREDFSLDQATLAICRRLKAAFDPHNRLSPELSRSMGLT